MIRLSMILNLSKFSDLPQHRTGGGLVEYLWDTLSNPWVIHLFLLDIFICRQDDFWHVGGVLDIIQRLGQRSQLSSLFFEACQAFFLR